MLFDESAEILSMGIGLRIEDGKVGFLGILKSVINIEGVFTVIGSAEKNSPHKMLPTRGGRRSISTRPRPRISALF